MSETGTDLPGTHIPGPSRRVSFLPSFATPPARVRCPRCDGTGWVLNNVIHSADELIAHLRQRIPPRHVYRCEGHVQRRYHTTHVGGKWVTPEAVDEAVRRKLLRPEWPDAPSADYWTVQHPYWEAEVFHASARDAPQDTEGGEPSALRNADDEKVQE
jgi:hypothetical protein